MKRITTPIKLFCIEVIAMVVVWVQLLGQWLRESLPIVLLVVPFVFGWFVGVVVSFCIWLIAAVVEGYRSGRL
ncbi:hypothetical protein [Herpetosiphon giganteus]|uniref:hypothetical protein n=1 Tax=Herpetosiphon giganteus TaxID=2029754 RepID=UPI00195969C8|nr:hypothetical protein [Herpetosiphon giganteus]MBM7843760.1 hypothetical protein [Herpetosiphon giganteus]